MKPPPSHHIFYMCIGSVAGQCKAGVNFCQSCHPDLVIPLKVFSGHYRFRCASCTDIQEHPLKYIKKDHRFGEITKQGEGEPREWAFFWNEATEKYEKTIVSREKYEEYVSKRYGRVYFSPPRWAFIEEYFWDDNNEELRIDESESEEEDVPDLIPINQMEGVD